MHRYALSLVAVGLTIGLVPQAHAEEPRARSAEVLAERGEVPPERAASESSAHVSVDSAPVSDRSIPATLSPASSAPSLASDAHRGSTQRTVGWVLGGAGLVSVGAGLVVGMQALAVKDDADANCATLDGEKRCFAGSSDQRAQAQSYAIASNVLLGLGVVSLVSGAIVYFTSPTATPERRTASIAVAPAVAPGTAGLVAVGRF